mgnify:CR=1 FL=1
MVEYKCVLKKVDKQAPAKKERKTRSDKGGHHKRTENPKPEKATPKPAKKPTYAKVIEPKKRVAKVAKVLPSQAKKKKIKFNVVPKGTFEKRQKAKESAEATQEFLKKVAAAKSKAKPAKKKKRINFIVKKKSGVQNLLGFGGGSCERDCQRARERNLGSGKQPSLDMLKRY